MQLIEGLERLFWSRSNCDVVRQIDPANNAVGINQKLGRTRDIAAFRPGASMQEIVAPDDCGIRIRKQRKRETHPLTMLLICIHGIDADGHDTNTARIEFRKFSLKTPQLGVTKRSPVAAIENQQRALAREKIGERDLFAVLVGQCELRRFFADARRRSRSRQLAHQIERSVSKQTETRQAQKREYRSEDFASISLRSAKSADETANEQDSADTKQQKIRPREVAGDRKLDEEIVTKERDEDENESNP